MILMYHNIGHEPGFNTVALETFREQLLFVKQHFQVVPMEEYINSLGTSKNNNQVVISFDDAYQSFSDLALPEMEKLGLPSILYIPVDFIGKSNEWDHKCIHIEIMNTSALKNALHSGLVTPGAHGKTHRRLSSLSRPEIESEIKGSKQELEGLLGTTITHFSFPYGQKKDYTSYALTLLKESGFVSAVSTNYSLHSSFANRYELNRIEVEPTDTRAGFEAKCKRRFHPKFVKQQVKNLLYKTIFR